MKKPKQILWLGLFFFLSWSLQAEQKKLKLNPWYASQTIFASGVAEALLILQTPTMINPKIDRGSTIFSYFSKPTYQLGLPGQHWATMVTPEGWLFNGEADLVFLDQNLNPIKQRLYTLYKGWIPAIQYQLKRRGLIYKVEAFQFWLEGEFKGVPINFIRFSVKNSSSEKKTAGLGVGFRYGTSDHRLAGMRKEKFNPFWKYKFKENYILRDGKLIYYFDQPPSKKWQFKTRAYKKGNFYILEPDRICAIVQYQFELAPGEKRSFTFKFPQSVLNPTPELLAQLSRADFETCLKALKSFWTSRNILLREKSSRWLTDFSITGSGFGIVPSMPGCMLYGDGSLIPKGFFAIFCNIRIRAGIFYLKKDSWTALVRVSGHLGNSCGKQSD